MTVWIVNPFDNLPLEGYRPQRYWMMSRAFADAGHDVTLFTSDFNHTTKKKRAVVRDCGFTNHDPRTANHEPRTTNHEPRFAVRFIPTRPYFHNVSIARVVSHRKLASNWLACATKVEKKPDVVIASLPPIRLPLFAKAYADSVGAKFVVAIMDDWPGTFYRLLPRGLRWLGPLLFSGSRRNVRYLYAHADLVTGVADRYADLALSAGAKRYLRFYHGIKLSDSALQLQLKTPTKKLLYLGNLGRTYDLRTAIEAVALDPQLTLDIAGKGEQEDALKEFAAEKGVTDRVRFHGYLNESALAELAATCSYGLIPMSDESCVGIPYKFADYARFGLHILSSLRGESAALLDKYHCGALYTHGDPRSLVEKVEKVGGGGQRNLNSTVPLPLSTTTSLTTDFNALFSELDATRIYRDYVAEVEKL